MDEITGMEIIGAKSTSSKALTHRPGKILSDTLEHLGEAASLVQGMGAHPGFHRNVIKMAFQLILPENIASLQAYRRKKWEREEIPGNSNLPPPKYAEPPNQPYDVSMETTQEIALTFKEALQELLDAGPEVFGTGDMQVTLVTIANHFLACEDINAIFDALAKKDEPSSAEMARLREKYETKYGI